MRRRYRFLLLLVAAFTLMASSAPLVLASRSRVLREIRAWALDAVLLDDRGVIFQTSRVNCGHTCLIMALAQKNVPVPVSLIREAQLTKAGLTAAEVAQRARAAGVPAALVQVPVTCLEQALLQMPLPAIALVGTHYVLITGRPDAGAVTLIDPSIGRMKRRLDSLSRNWRGAVVSLGHDSAVASNCGGSQDEVGEV